MGGTGEPIAMPVEIIVSDKKPGNEILGYKEIRENQEKVIAIDDKNIYESVAAIARNAFKALGARDYGRIDILMDDQNRPYFLEANLVPGMTRRPRDIDCSYFIRACFINTDITYQETIHKIAGIALSRIKQTNNRSMNVRHKT